MYLYLKYTEWFVGFVEPLNMYTESFIKLYNIICMYLLSVTFLIAFWLIYILVNYKFKNKNPIDLVINDYVYSGKNKWLRKFIHQNENDRIFAYLHINDVQEFTFLEAIWVFIPILFIVSVAYPSISLEYSLSPDITPLVTLKVIGHQWYWDFELITSLTPGLIESNDSKMFLKSDLYNLFINEGHDFLNFLNKLENLDYMHLRKDLSLNLVAENQKFLRLLSLDNKLILPVNVPIKLIITSADVLHSFALPSLAVKIDAVPGRLSEQIIVCERPGLIWGQCSELCGPYHGFMPVVIEVCDLDTFLDYMLST